MQITDIHKVEKKNCINISAFGYEKYPIGRPNFILKNTFKKHVDLLLIEGENTSRYVLIKGTLMQI